MKLVQEVIALLDPMQARQRGLLAGHASEKKQKNRAGMDARVKPPYIIPAQLPNSWIRFHVDMCPLIVVAAGKAKVLDPIWGRSSFALSGILNKVSQGAFELVLLSQREFSVLLKAEAAR